MIVAGVLHLLQSYAGAWQAVLTACLSCRLWHNIWSACLHAYLYIQTR